MRRAAMGTTRRRLARASSTMCALSAATMVTVAACATGGRLEGVTATDVSPSTAATTVHAAASTNASPVTDPTTSAPAIITTTIPMTTVPATTIAATTTPSTTVPPTVPPTAAPPRPGALLALDVLGSIRVENEHRGGYVRESFGYPADLDGDGCNTRAEVLLDEATGLVQIDTPGCLVREGDWVSLYDGLAVTDAAELEIDHVVALKEAWDSGAWRWDPLTLVAFGNDLDDDRTLRAVTSSTNRSKSDKDPSNWLPPADSAVCEYLGDWVTVKARWSLTMDQSEYGRIRNLLRGGCAGTTVAPFTPVAATAGSLDRQFAPPSARGPGYRSGRDGVARKG